MVVKPWDSVPGARSTAATPRAMLGRKSAWIFMIVVEARLALLLLLDRLDGRREVDELQVLGEGIAVAPAQDHRPAGAFRGAVQTAVRAADHVGGEAAAHVVRPAVEHDDLVA